MAAGRLAGSVYQPAPPALRARVREFALAATGKTRATALAAAGQAALERVLSHVGDRSAALDLLAADALITLALQAQAEDAPEQLEEFATSVLRTSRHGRVIDLHSHLLPAVDDGSRYGGAVGQGAVRHGSTGRHGCVSHPSPPVRAEPKRATAGARPSV